MTFLTSLEIISLGALFAALLFLGLAWRPVFRRSHQLILMAAIAMLALVTASNVLHWTGISDALQSFEEPLEIMALTLLGMFFYSFQQHARELQLREREEWYLRLFNNTNDAIYVYGFLRDGRPGPFREVNDAACRMLDYPRNELLTLSLPDIDEVKAVTEHLKVSSRILEGGAATFERVHVARDGRLVPVELNAHLFVHQGRQSVLAVARDISERKEAERKIREVQLLDEKILEASPVAFLLVDRQNRVLRASRAYEDVGGSPLERVLGLTPLEILPDPDFAQAVMDRLNQAREEKKTVGPQEIEPRREESLFVRETIIPIVDHEGEAAHLLVVLEDITSLKLIERELRRVRELDQKILDNSPIALVLQDMEMRVVRTGRAYQRVTGFDPSRVLGRTLSEFMPEGPSRDGIIARVRGVQETGQISGPLDFVSPLGRSLRETIVPITGEAGEITNTLSILEDLTERHAFEEKARHSEERYRLLFESIQDGILLHESPDEGPPGLIIEANERLCQMTGYNLEELRRMRPTDIGEPISREKIGETGRLLREGKSLVFERTVVAKDGHRVPVENMATRFELEGSPVVLAVLRDISERKRAEERIMGSLREKEVLLREVHHRVKNNLHVISGLLNLQARHIGDAGVKEVYRESQNRIKTMALIHEELYGKDNLASINFSEYIRCLVENLKDSYGLSQGPISVRLEVEPVNLVLDTAIPCGLIVNELVSNAFKHAFPEGGRGVVTVSFGKTGAGRFFLKVSDDGVGLPEDIDPRHPGSLGLRLVALLVDQMGSRLEVDLGRGASYSFEFDEYQEAGSDWS